jgi:hypothetical protein
MASPTPPRRRHKLFTRAEYRAPAEPNATRGPIGPVETTIGDVTAMGAPRVTEPEPLPDVLPARGRERRKAGARRGEKSAGLG